MFCCHSIYNVLSVGCAIRCTAHAPMLSRPLSLHGLPACCHGYSLCERSRKPYIISFLGVMALIFLIVLVVSTADCCCQAAAFPRQLILGCAPLCNLAVTRRSLPRDLGGSRLCLRRSFFSSGSRATRECAPKNASASFRGR